MRPAGIARCCSGRTITTRSGCRRRRSLCCRSATSPWSSATERASPPACCARRRPGRRPRPSRSPASASSTRRSCAALRVAHARGVTGHPRLPARVRAWPRGSACTPTAACRCASGPRCRPSALDEIIALGLRSGLGDDWLRIGPVKAFADGTLGSRTASMLEPFADAGRGEALLSADELRDLAGQCADAGLELAVHAIGDAANRAVLDALEATRERWAPRRLRPRIEHAQLLHPDDLARFADARRDGVDAALARALRPLARRGGLGRPLRRRLRTRIAERERSARCASAPMRRSSRSTPSPASRPPSRATGRSPRRSRSSSRWTASGAAPPTHARPSAASGGCCPASRPTSSCSSAIPSPVRRTRSPGSRSSPR